MSDQGHDLIPVLHKGTTRNMIAMINMTRLRERDTQKELTAMRRMIGTPEMRSPANMIARTRMTNIIINTTTKLTGMMEIKRSMIEKTRSTMIMGLKNLIKQKRMDVTDLVPGIGDGKHSI